MTRWAILFALTGCLNKDRFNEKYADEVCLLYSECEVLDLEGYSTARTCRQTLGQHTDQCDEFDSAGAKSCIAAIRGFSCEDMLERGLPGICDDVCSQD
jgi:hypothetical protein